MNARGDDGAPMATTGGGLPPGPSARASVPWSLRRTILGVTLTVVPWLIFNLSLAAVSGSISGAPRVTLSRQADIATGIAVFILSGLLEALFLIAPLVIAWRTRRPGARWSDRLGWLGLRQTALVPALAVAVIGFGIALAGSALYSWVVTTLHLPLQTNTDALLAQGRSQPFTTLGLLLAAAIFAPICEEIFFRGFAFAGLLKGMPLWPAMLISSAIFAIAHTSLGSLIPLFIIGIILAWARWRTDSLWPGVAIHMANNTLAMATLIPLLFK